MTSAEDARTQPAARDAAVRDGESQQLVSGAGQAHTALVEALAEGDVDSDVVRRLRAELSTQGLPHVAGVTLAARYRPGGGEQLGGDWFDALEVGAHGLLLVLGDVAGHGIAAAATMHQLRSAVRAYAITDASPASLLGRLDTLVARLWPEEMATVVAALLATDTGAVRLASAGHVPPLLTQAGTSQTLSQAHGRALGVGAEQPYLEHVIQLAAGGILTLYSDGLVERRTANLDEGLRRLAAQAAADDDLERFCDRLIAAAEPDGDDDMALLAIRWDGAP